MRIDTRFINELDYNGEDKAVLANTFKVLEYKRAAGCKCGICQGIGCEHCNGKGEIGPIDLDRRNYHKGQLEYEKKKREELFEKYSTGFDFYDDDEKN